MLLIAIKFIHLHSFETFIKTLLIEIINSMNSEQHLHILNSVLCHMNEVIGMCTWQLQQICPCLPANYRCCCYTQHIIHVRNLNSCPYWPNTTVYTHMKAILINSPTLQIISFKTQSVAILRGGFQPYRMCFPLIRIVFKTFNSQINCKTIM